MKFFAQFEDNLLTLAQSAEAHFSSRKENLLCREIRSKR